MFKIKLVEVYLEDWCPFFFLLASGTSFESSIWMTFIIFYIISSCLINGDVEMSDNLIGRDDSDGVDGEEHFSLIHGNNPETFLVSVTLLSVVATCI